MTLTATDLFCGAGGSSLGAEKAGVRLRLGLNHWRRAIETHAHNFTGADHDCADISALTTERIRSYPDTDLLLASPECTNHSLAKGAQRKKPLVASLFDDGPEGSDEADRSRATMWDVPRFLEQKLTKGAPYKAVVVENVTDAVKWGPNDNGALFETWRTAITALDYEHEELVFLNSAFAPPTPQSRDRLYVVCWQKGMRRPNLDFSPPSWCPHCEKIVDGQQIWKRVGPRPWEKGGRYGVQYLYHCPDCRRPAIPGAHPAASAIDFRHPAEKIGQRARPLAEKTLARIRRGLERLGSEPFAIRTQLSGAPKPLTLPVVSLTARMDMAMVFPVSGNTHESSSGNRARDAGTRPMDTIHGTHCNAIVIPFTRNTNPQAADQEPTHTVTSGGYKHGLIISNYGPGGGNKEGLGGWERNASELPFGTITATDGHSLVVPYNRTGVPSPVWEPTHTATTREGLGLVVPNTWDEAQEAPGKEWTDAEIDECRFRHVRARRDRPRHADGDPPRRRRVRRRRKQEGAHEAIRQCRHAARHADHRRTPRRGLLMARHEETLSHALRNILADLDEAFLRLGLDRNNDERGLDCLTRARKEVQDVIEKLEEEVRMRPLVP